jgi:hypothetical protein
VHGGGAGDHPAGLAVLMTRPPKPAGRRKKARAH